MSQLETDIYYMQQALICADDAEKSGEVPVGAVVVMDKQLISTAYNQTIAKCDPTAHAEMIVLKQAAKQSNNHRLLGATLYVTLEPCLMCVGAMIQARIKRLVFGAYDNRLGAVVSLFHLLSLKCLNHSFDFTDGILADRCAKRLQQFFKQKRHSV
jgi:tRNA(adenine34) deaminase